MTLQPYLGFRSLVENLRATDYARSFGPARVSILPGVGHWVPLIAPEQLAVEVDPFQLGGDVTKLGMSKRSDDSSSPAARSPACCPARNEARTRPCRSSEGRTP